MIVNDEVCTACIVIGEIFWRLGFKGIQTPQPCNEAVLFNGTAA